MDNPISAAFNVDSVMTAGPDGGGKSAREIGDMSSETSSDSFSPTSSLLSISDGDIKLGGTGEDLKEPWFSNMLISLGRKEGTEQRVLALTRDLRSSLLN